MNSFHYPCRSLNGKTLPSWLNCPGPVLIRRHIRSSKYDPLVEERKLIKANPDYALVRYNNGREATVSLRDLAPPGDGKLLEGKKDREHTIESLNLEAPVDNCKVVQECMTENKDNFIAEPILQNEGLGKSISEVDEPKRSARTRNKPKYLEDYKM